MDSTANSSLFKATKSKSVNLLDCVKVQNKSYQRITLTVNQQASKAGEVILTIDGNDYPARLYSESTTSTSLTAAQICNGLKKEMGKTFVLSKSNNVITIYKVFGGDISTYSFNSNSTGCNVNIAKGTESGPICSYDGNIYEGDTVVVDEVFNFGGGNLALPANVQLRFKGGCLLNANIKYNNTRIVGECNILNCFCSGKLANSEVFPEMFGARTSNLPNSDYDISEPIQAALDSGNLNIVVDSSNTYIWKNTVKLYNEADYSQEGSTTAQEWHVSIRGTSEAPFTYKGALHSKYNVLILADTVFSCSPHQGDAGMDFSFHFHTVAWPSIHLSHLSFRFQNDVVGKTFIEGIISASVINGVHVYGSNRFINGGLKRSSVVTNCRVETREYAFGGYMSDSKVVNNSFCGITHEDNVNPNFYMNSIYYGNERIKGSHWGCIYSNNYIEYYYTVFVVSDDSNNCINTAGNTIDIFKYYARAEYWHKGASYDASNEKGCRIYSNGDMFMRCNNLPDTDSNSTDKLLGNNPRITIDGKKEVYGVLSKIMYNSIFQINSVFHDTCDYIFAKDKIANGEDAKFSTNPSFAFGSDVETHRGEFICGGKPSMYNFTHLSSSTAYLPNNQRFRRPVLHDLQDMAVTALPQEQLFNGRRVIYNNKIYTFKQTDARAIGGNWDD